MLTFIRRLVIIAVLIFLAILLYKRLFKGGKVDVPVVSNVVENVVEDGKDLARDGIDTVKEEFTDNKKTKDTQNEEKQSIEEENITDDDQEKDEKRSRWSRLFGKKNDEADIDASEQESNKTEKTYPENVTNTEESDDNTVNNNNEEIIQEEVEDVNTETLSLDDLERTEDSPDRIDEVNKNIYIEIAELDQEDNIKTEENLVPTVDKTPKIEDIQEIPTVIAPVVKKDPNSTPVVKNPSGLTEYDYQVTESIFDSIIE